MITDFDHEPRLFTPADAERITGVSVTLQRDWRRRGILPGQDGHARFDAFALAEMLFLRVMADRGIGPLTKIAGLPLKDFADGIGARIVAHALRWQDAWAWPANGPASSNRLAVAAAGEVVGIAQARFLVWLPDGSMPMTSALGRFLDGFASSDDALFGAVIVLDLEALGSGMLKRADGPLFTITRLQVSDTEPGSTE